MQRELTHQFLATALLAESRSEIAVDVVSEVFPDQDERIDADASLVGLRVAIHSVKDRTDQWVQVGRVKGSASIGPSVFKFKTPDVPIGILHSPQDD